MATRENDLPEFENPPVVEVALAVHFRSVPGLEPDVLAGWSKVRGRLPKWRLRDRMNTPTEVFGLPQGIAVPQIQFTRAGEAPPTRSWFMNDAETELLQIQPDALVRNWRKMSGSEEYPRYERIRADFQRDFGLFEELLAEHELGEVTPTQCEVTYVNHLDLAPDNSGRVLAGFSGAASDEFLPEPEQALVGVRYIMREHKAGDPVGRLHVHWAPALKKDGTPTQQLRLTARGAPLGPGLGGVLDWFDLGREWVVRGFASFTHPHMHEHAWERSQ